MLIQVYHANDTAFRDTSFGHDLAGKSHLQVVAENWAAGNYDWVANVEVDFDDGPDGLDAAYALTNHIETNWTENKEIAAHAVRVRSTSVGDIMLVQDDESYHVVTNLGFEPIELPEGGPTEYETTENIAVVTHGQRA